MKQKEIEALESFINTENEHWNKHTFRMLQEIVKQGTFEKPETPLQLFSNAIELFTENHEHPIKALQLFNEELEKQKLTQTQKLFVCEWVYTYLNETEFPEIDLYPVQKLLESHKERLKAGNQPETDKPLTSNIRETLKTLMQKELEQLPETLKELEPLQRLNILCKLMPFVLPKVESVNHTQGEPNKNGFDW